MVSQALSVRSVNVTVDHECVRVSRDHKQTEILSEIREFFTTPQLGHGDVMKLRSWNLELPQERI